jgi:hypothetical protein
MRGCTHLEVAEYCAYVQANVRVPALAYADPIQSPVLEQLCSVDVPGLKNCVHCSRKEL